MPEDEYQEQYNAVTEKICLCEGLCSSTYIKHDLVRPKENKAVAICPGPNLAYFSRVYSLDEMVQHIYGKINLLDKIARPHVFVKELNLYIDYLQTDIQNHLKNLSDKKARQIEKFKAQLLSGIDYYKNLFDQFPASAAEMIRLALTELSLSEAKLNELQLSV